MNLRILLTSILLLPVIYCNKDHQEDHEETEKTKNWMQFLPNHVQHILKSKITTTTLSDDESASSIQESTEPLITGEKTNSSATPEIMYGSNSSSNNSVPIGVSIGSLIFFFLICYCCYKCCCQSRQTISQGIIVSQPMPPPQDLNQPNIVIQHIHGTPHLQSAQPGMVQHVQHTHAPPPMVQPQFQQPQFQQPQFQQPPSYPAGYETRQMLQQEWSPHAPMNIEQQQQQQQYPAPDYPYNPSAPPPSYGKY